MAVTGRVVSVAKLGDRWRAEVEVGTAKVVVIGQPGAGIAEHDARDRPDGDRHRHRAAALPERHGSAVRGHAPFPGRRPRRGPRRCRTPAPATGSSGGTASPARPPARPGARHRRTRRRPRRPRRADRRASCGSAGWSSTCGPTASRSTTAPRSVGSSCAARRSSGWPSSSPTTRSTRSAGSEAATAGADRRRRRSGGHHPRRRPRRRGRAASSDASTRTVAGPSGTPADARWLGRSARRPGRPLAARRRDRRASARWLAISAASVAVTLLRRGLSGAACPPGSPADWPRSRRPRSETRPEGRRRRASAERGPSTIHSA